MTSDVPPSSAADGIAGSADLERAYLIDCLRGLLFQPASLPPLPAGLDWRNLLHWLNEEQLAGLFAHLTRLHPGWLPSELSERLLYYRFHQLLRHADQASPRVAAILGALREHHIPVIVLKGWALVQLVYGGDHSQRTASDIDLLVLPGDVAQVGDLLHGLGYHDLAMEPWPGYFQRFLNSSHYVSDALEAGSASAFNVDLHWGVPDPPYYDRRIQLQPLFARAGSISTGGIEVGSLAAEDDLLYAAVHMAHHGYREMLSRFYDQAALIRQAGPGLDWEAVLQRAADWRVIIPLRRMLSELNALWPGIIPSSMMEHLLRLKPSLGERIVDWGLTRSANHEAANILLSVGNTPGFFWRVRFFLETAFPGSAYLRYYFGQAPGGLWPLLYFRRFIRFIKG